MEDSKIISIFAPVIRLFRYKHNKKNDNLTYKEVRMDFFKEIKNPVKFLRHIYVSITYRIVRIFDRRRDQRVCGCSLTKRYATNVEGGTKYSGTCYWTLEEIFADSEFTNEDSLVDVGCGQGRLFAYLIEQHFPGKMTGIEYDAETADIAKAWTAKYPEKNIRIIQGDAFAQQYDEYTVFYLFNPFTFDYFVKFIDLLESQLTHPIRFYYMSDQGKSKILNQRPGWEILFRRKSFKKYGLCMWGSTQHYSLWKYTPTHRN